MANQTHTTSASFEFWDLRAMRAMAGFDTFGNREFIALLRGELPVEVPAIADGALHADDDPIDAIMDDAEAPPLPAPATPPIVLDVAAAIGPLDAA